MATAGGPNIEREGLVFGYDTGQEVTGGTVASRHYKGRPAENLFQVMGVSSNVDQNVTFPVNGTGIFQRVANGTRIGDYSVHEDDVVYRYNLGGTGCHYHGNDYPNVQAGTQITLTIDYYLTPDVQIVTNYLGNFEQLAGVGGSWGSVSSETGKWHTVTLTRTATGTGNLRMLMYPGACGGSTLSNQGAIYYRNPTVTMTPHQVPFRQGTLSNTEALLDFKGNRTISLANTSFNSTNHPALDGTDEYLDLGSDWVVSTGGGWTVESVVRYNSVAGGYDNYISPANFIGSDSISYNSWYWSVLNNKLALWNISPGVWKYGSTIIQPNTYYHVTLVSYENGTQYQMYLNGVAEGGDHTTYSWNASYSGLRVRYFGAGQSSRRFVNGEIPITKIYNRALTADEVLQNFKGYKNRFGL